MKNIAIVLISGGMDSAVTAAIAREQGYEIAALHLNYGQRTQERELEAFNMLADHFDSTNRLIVDIQYLAQIGGSSLTDKNIEVSKADLGNKEIPTSYVPFRNANIMAIATSWAEVINARAIFIGAMEEDSSGYPDCRQVFFEAFQQVINYGTKPETKIKLVAPLLHMSKKDVILKGNDLGVPFWKTWSCYENNRVACGECDSCALRLRGFRMAGLRDPLDYKSGSYN